MTYPRTFLEGRCHLKPHGTLKSPAPPVLRLPSWLSGKGSAYNAGDMDLIPGWKITWRRKWQSIPVFLPGKSHEQRSLAGHSPRSCSQIQLSD